MTTNTIDELKGIGLAEERSIPSVARATRPGHAGKAAFILLIAIVGIAAFIVYKQIRSRTVTVEAPVTTTTEIPDTQQRNKRKFGADMESLSNPSLPAIGAPPPPFQNGIKVPAPTPGSEPAKPIDVLGNAGSTPGLIPAATTRLISIYDSGFAVSGMGNNSTSTVPEQTAEERMTNVLAGLASKPSPTQLEKTQSTLGNLLTGTATNVAKATVAGHPNFSVAKGTQINCTLDTKVNSALPGLVRCVLPFNLYSRNGKVVLAERGTEVIGESSGQMKMGQTRQFILWTRMLTPRGISIDIDSPAADGLGTSGLESEINNHWIKRIGASLMLSLIQDSVAYAIAKEGDGGQASNNAAQSTTQAGQKLAEKVLESTINIPPTAIAKQGDNNVVILFARDLDFSGVYELQPK